MSKKLHHLRGTLSRMVETGTKWPWAAAAYQSQLLHHIEKLTQRVDELEKRVTELEASIDEDAAEQMRYREQVEQRLAALEKNSHPPVDMRNYVDEKVEKLRSAINSEFDREGLDVAWIDAL